jgi:hypothetical protein
MIRRGEEPVIDADFVRYRLEEAGKCLLSLPGGRVGPAQLSAQSYGFVSEIVEGSGFVSRTKVAVPDAATITRMDEALGWLPLIDTVVIRRIVAMRCLISPVTDRHLHTWRSIGLKIEASHTQAAAWHEAGVQTIVRALKELRRGNGAKKQAKPHSTPWGGLAMSSVVDRRAAANAEWQKITTN